MIKIEQHPYPFVLSNNPIRYHLKGLDFSAEKNIYPSIRLNLNTIIDVNCFIRFQFINPNTGGIETIRFISKENPDLSSGEEIPGVNGGAPFNIGWRSNLATAFGNNELLMNYFEIAPFTTPQQLILVAKKPISELIPFNWSANDKPISNNPQAITYNVSEVYWRASKRANHRIAIRVMFEHEYLSNQFNLVAEENETTDENGNVITDVSSIIHSEIKNSYSEPPVIKEIDPDTNDKVIKTNLIRRFYVEFAEIYKDIGDDIKWTKSDIATTHFGGVSTDDFEKINIADYLVHQKMPLTWWKENKRLFPHQSDWLGFINASIETTAFNFVCKIYYKDQTDDGFPVASQISLNPWESVAIPVGYQQLNIDQEKDPNKEVYSWKIEVRKDGLFQDLEMEKKYILGEISNYNHQDIIYLNSFNMPESFVTTGNWKRDFSTSKEIAVRSITHDFKKINGQNHVFQNNMENTYTAYSGTLSSKEAENLKAMLSTTSTFLYNKGEFLPVIIDSESFTTLDESSLVQNLQFSVTKSTRERNYSRTYQKAKLSILKDCDRYIVRVITDLPYELPNQLEIKYGNSTMNVFQSGNIYVSQPIDFEGMLYFEVEIVLNGNISTLNSSLYNSYESFHFKTPNTTFNVTYPAFGFNIAINGGAPAMNLYVDWSFDNTLNQYSVPFNGQTIIFIANSEWYGSKIVKNYAMCLDRVKSLEMNNTLDFDISKMVNLKELRMMQTKKEFLSIASFKKLEAAYFEGSDLEFIEVGMLTELNLLDLKDCSFGIEGFQKIVDELWRYRKMMGNNGTLIIDMSGNPDSNNLPQDLTDKILGNNEFAGDGLWSNDIFLIS